MAIYFLDSSALVKRYRTEAGSERIADLIASSERVVISRLAQVEVSAAIVRRGRAAAVPARDLDTVLATLDRDISDSFDVVELDEPIMERATMLARRHGLRAADAVQLACALFAHADAARREFAVVGTDRELKAAALAEGLVVVDPT